VDAGPTTASVAWRSLRQRALWFGPDDRPLLGWLTQPASGPGATGVVVVPPLGYEYWTTHRALRALAERLAAQGCSVLRFDLDGTGDWAEVEVLCEEAFRTVAPARLLARRDPQVPLGAVERSAGRGRHGRDRRRNLRKQTRVARPKTFSPGYNPVVLPT